MDVCALKDLRGGTLIVAFAIVLTIVALFGYLFPQGSAGRSIVGLLVLGGCAWGAFVIR